MKIKDLLNGEKSILPNEHGPGSIESDRQISNIEILKILKDDEKYVFLYYLDLLKKEFGREVFIKLYKKPSIRNKEFINIIIKLGQIYNLSKTFFEFKKIDEIIEYKSLYLKLCFINKNISEIELLKYLSFGYGVESMEIGINKIIKNKNTYFIANLNKYFEELISIKSKKNINLLILNFSPLDEAFIDFFGLDFFKGMSDERIKLIAKLTFEDIKREIIKAETEVNKADYEVKNNGYMTVLAKKTIKTDKSENKNELKNWVITKLLKIKTRNFIKRPSGSNTPNKKREFTPIKINKEYPLSPELKEKFDYFIGNFKTDYIKGKKENGIDDFGNNFLLTGELKNWKVLYGFLFYLIDIINKSKNKSEIEKIPQILLNIRNSGFGNGKKSESNGYILMVNGHYKERIRTF